MKNLIHSRIRSQRQPARRARRTDALRLAIGVGLVCTLGCEADDVPEHAPSWQGELSQVDAGAIDGSASGADIVATRSWAALPQASQRAQQQRIGESTRWFAPYDQQVWEQRADGTIHRSLNDGRAFARLTNDGVDGAPQHLLHGGFASDGGFWGVEANTIWHYDGHAWFAHDAETVIGSSAGTLALISPDPASTSVLLASTSGQLWRIGADASGWQRVKVTDNADAGAPTFGQEGEERFEFDATIAGRVWHITERDAWYADLDSAGHVQWSEDTRPAAERHALPMRAPRDPHWL